jgi:hypothetical protein
MTRLLMHRRTMLRVSVATGLTTLGVVGNTLARADKDVELSEVPEGVRKAADKAVPGVTWAYATKDKDEDEEIYDVGGVDEKERHIEVEITADGKVRKVQKDIDLKDVPKVVTSALKDKQPKFKPESVAELYFMEKLVAYQFDGKREGKQPKGKAKKKAKDKEDAEEVSVLVTADGTRVVVDVGD